MRYIGILGDTHTNWYWMVRVLATAKENGISTIIQLGDFGYWPRAAKGAQFLQDVSDVLTRNHMQMWWLGGNHEDWDSIEGQVSDHDNWRTATDKIEVLPSLYYLPDGLTFTLRDKVFGVCGGGTSIDEEYRSQGWDFFPQEIVLESAVNSLSQHKLDILLTHDCGGTVLNHRYIESNRKLPNRIVAKTLTDDRLIGELRHNTAPVLQFHGHHHYAHFFVDGATTIFGMAEDGNAEGSFGVLDVEDMRFWRIPVSKKEP